MKLHIENTESKFEYYNKIKKENKYLNEKIKKLNDSKKENEIIILKTENKNLKEIIKEKEEDILRNEKDFADKFFDLNKKMLNYEEVMKYQSTKNLVDSENDKSVNILLFNLLLLLFILFFLLIKTNKSTYSMHKRSKSYLTGKCPSPTVISNYFIFF